MRLFHAIGLAAVVCSGTFGVWVVGCDSGGPGGDASLVSRIVLALQAMEGVGSIFRNVRGARLEGTGTLPIGCVGVGGALAPDILYSNDWSNDANVHGCSGTAWSSPGTMAATHGSISPWDVRNTLIVAGPSFKRGVVSAVPAGNVDIAPTLIHTPTEAVSKPGMGSSAIRTPLGKRMSSGPPPCAGPTPTPCSARL